jgi:hypothetical protein
LEAVMIEIVLMQCLLSDIKHCRTVHIPMIDVTTISRCKDRQENRLYEFGKEYPLWFNRTWRCDYVDNRKGKQDL